MTNDAIKERINSNFIEIFRIEPVYKKTDFKAAAGKSLIIEICNGVLNLTQICKSKGHTYYPIEFIAVLEALYTKGLYYELLMFVRLVSSDESIMSREKCIEYLNRVKDLNADDKEK